MFTSTYGELCEVQRRRSEPPPHLELLIALHRCDVWDQLTNLRTPVDDLRAYNSDLAGRIVEVSKRLQTFGLTENKPGIIDAPFSEKVSAEDEARTHLALAHQWEELLSSARAIPGFELDPRCCPIDMI